MEANPKENENDDGSEANTPAMNIEDKGAENMNNPGSKSHDNEMFEDRPVEEEGKMLKAVSDPMKILQDENEPSVEEKMSSNPNQIHNSTNEAHQGLGSEEKRSL